MANIPGPDNGGTSSKSSTPATNKNVLLYGVSALLVIALAGYQPKLAMLFVGLLVLGVLVVHGQDYADLLATFTGQK